MTLTKLFKENKKELQTINPEDIHEVHEKANRLQEAWKFVRIAAKVAKQEKTGALIKIRETETENKFEISGKSFPIRKRLRKIATWNPTEKIWTTDIDGIEELASYAYNSRKLQIELI